MNEFLKEIAKLWWVEVGTELQNPLSENSIKGLRKILKEEYDFDSEVIEYIVESAVKTPTNFHLGGDRESGMQGGTNDTAVSAHLHHDEEDDEDGAIDYDEPLEEEEEDDKKLPSKEKDGDSEEDDKAKVDADIQQNALTAKEKEKLEEIDDKLLNTKLTKPTTGNKNQVSTLLGKKKSDPTAYKVGKNFLGDKGVSDDDIEKQSDSDSDDTSKPTADESYESAKQKVKEIYGDDGKLLQNSETSDAALNNGYQEGADWVAPGNAGSNFNENMSNEASLIIEKYPDINESELASIIFEKSRDTKLGKQQKSTTVESPSKKDRGEIQSDIPTSERDLYRATIITDR